MQSKRMQAGFTLVEIAIVLVIIGLLLGGILKGQEMITQARIKNVVNDFNGITAAYFAYQDRYRAVPGDDNQAARPLGEPEPARRLARTVTATASSPACTWPHRRRCSGRHRRPPSESNVVLVAPAPRGLRRRRHVGSRRPGVSRSMR